VLIFTREKNESVMVVTRTGRIEVRILDITNNKVRLGFDAPKTILIDRKEIFFRKVKNGAITDNTSRTP